MKTITERADSILHHLEGYAKRRQMEEDAQTLYEKMHKINATFPSVLLSLKFLSEIDDSLHLEEPIRNHVEKYEEIRKQFVSIWGEDNQKFSINEVSGFFEPPECFINFLKESDSFIREILIKLKTKCQNEKSVMESHVTIITNVNTEPFRNREYFLNNLGKDHTTIFRFLNGWYGYKDKILEWQKIDGECKKEADKVNSEHDKRIKPKTREFIKQLSQSRNGVEFTSLEKETLLDITKNYPDIAQKLRICLRD
jgi:hypothetical protein